MYTFLWFLGRSRRLIRIFLFLTYFVQMFPFNTPWKYQKSKGFVVFSRGIKWDHRPKSHTVLSGTHKKSLLRWRSWVMASFYYFRWHLQKYLYSINYSNMSRLRFSFIFMSVWKVLFVEKLKSFWNQKQAARQ